VTIQTSVRGARWKRLTVIDSTGVYGFKTPHADRQRYRAKWKRPDGRTITGPPIRPY
jgi:hypothetical protein